MPHRLGYVAAKKAILGVTEGLALETVRAGITVNAIAPGYIATQTLMARADAGMLDKVRFAERTPVGHWGRPEEVTHAATILAQSASGFITGATLAVDGGFTIREGRTRTSVHPRFPYPTPETKRELAMFQTASMTLNLVRRRRSAKTMNCI